LSLPPTDFALALPLNTNGDSGAKPLSAGEKGSGSGVSSAWRLRICYQNNQFLGMLQPKTSAEKFPGEEEGKGKRPKNRKKIQN